MILDKVISNGATLEVPAHLSLGQNFLDKLRMNLKQEGSDKVALVNGNTGEETTYAALLQSTVNIAVGLERLGVKRGDVVAFCGESSPQFMAAVMGTVCCGAIATFYNFIATKDEIMHVLNLSRPRVIFCSATAMKDHLSTFEDTKSIKHIIQLDVEPLEENIRRRIPSFSSIQIESNVLCYEAAESYGNDTAMVFYSSGTTGLPKGVMLTHLNILYIQKFTSKQDSLKRNKSFLTVLPWYHIYGFLTSLTALTSHKQLVFMNSFIPEKYFSVIQEYRINCLILVPPVVVNIAKSTLVEKFDLTSVENMWSGAAPLSTEIVELARKRMPNLKSVLEGYGLTETTMVVLIKREDEVGTNSAVMRTVPGMKYKVVDCKTRDKLGPNEKGEICIKGLNVMKGYLNDEAATRGAFDEEGYLKTGDIGYYDEEECFFLIDRLKDIIKYKGHQVAPPAVENIVLQHSAVADCAVVGKPDEAAGELPTAFVVVKPGAMVTEADILDFTATKLSPIARLRGGVIFLDVIPKSTAGKILRRILRERLLKTLDR